MRRSRFVSHINFFEHLKRSFALSVEFLSPTSERTGTLLPGLEEKKQSELSSRRNGRARSNPETVWRRVSCFQAGGAPKSVSTRSDVVPDTPCIYARYPPFGGAAAATTARSPDDARPPLAAIIKGLMARGGKRGSEFGPACGVCFVAVVGPLLYARIGLPPGPGDDQTTTGRRARRTDETAAACETVDDDH